MSGTQADISNSQYSDSTYPGAIQKLLVVYWKGTRYFLGNPDEFHADEVTSFLANYPGAQVTVDWMIVPLEGGEEVGPFDTTLTPYPSVITLGDQDFPVDDYPQPTNPEAAAETWGGSFAYEVRALHPTQEDRIEKKLDELLVVAKKFLGE